MKRSEKFRKQALHHFLMSILTLSAVGVVVCWTPVAILSGSGVWVALAIVAAGVLTAAGFMVGASLMVDAYRLAAKAEREAMMEDERSIRPRL